MVDCILLLLLLLLLLFKDTTIELRSLWGRTQSRIGQLLIKPKGFSRRSERHHRHLLIHIPRRCRRGYGRHHFWRRAIWNRCCYNVKVERIRRCNSRCRLWHHFLLHHGQHRLQLLDWLSRAIDISKCRGQYTDIAHWRWRIILLECVVHNHGRWRSHLLRCLVK